MKGRPSHMDDKTIAERLKAGDQLVFEWLFTTKYAQLCFYATKLLGETAAAEEIVSETYEDVWGKKEQLQFTGSVISYLFSTVHNKCINHIKRSKLITAYKTHLLQHKTAFNPEDIPDHIYNEKAIHSEIRKAIDNLPDKCREIFYLSRFENKKYREIADLLELSPKTVENQISIALEKLRKSLKHLLISIILI